MSIRCAALVLLASASTGLAQAKIPGWTYAINITYDSGTGPANRGSMAMRYRTTDRALRMDFLQIAGAATRAMRGVDIESMYTIVNDADSTYVTVIPSQHAATVMQNPQYLVSNKQLPSVESHTVTTATEDLGSGGRILGHPTHHYRMKTTGSVTFKLADGPCTRSTDGETEVWIAPDVDIGPVMRSMVAHYGFTPPDSAAAMGLAAPMKGVPLRTITRTTAVLPGGESRVVEMTMEYVELSNTPLDASLFAIPSDYRVMDMRKQLAEFLAQGADSLMARGAQVGLCPH